MADTVVPCPGPRSPREAVHVVPEPRSLQLVGEGFTLRTTTPLLCQTGAEEPAEVLAQRLRDGLGWGGGPDLLPLAGPGQVPTPVAGAVSLLLDGDTDLGPEGYTLTCGADGVVLRAPTRVGLLHAVRTLLQVLPVRVVDPEGAAWGPEPDGTGALAHVPGVRVSDAPRLAHRGVMIDVARSFLPVDDLLRVVEAASLLKVNVLHLHLVDDQGWRLEVTNDGRADDDPHDYTRLTEVSGRTAVRLASWSGRSGRAGWYTQADYRRIVAYCRARGIEVVPEIDVPGHVGAALHALPGLCTPGSSYTGTVEQPTAPADDGVAVGSSYLDPDAPATRAFIRHVLTQVTALDPGGRRVHLGGDEPWEMARRYGAGTGTAYSRLLGYACQVVRELGRVPVGWNEAWPAAVETGTGPQADGDGLQLQVWDVRGREAAEGQRLAAQRGTRFIMSPAPHAYLDMAWDEQAPLGLTWAGTVDLRAARDWDPAAVVPGVGEDSVMGVEATVWAETARGVEDVETLLMPRLLGTAEAGWCEPLPQDRGARTQALEAFDRRCAAYGARLRAAGTSFVLTAGVPWRLAAPDTGSVADQQQHDSRDESGEPGAGGPGEDAGA